MNTIEQIKNCSRCKLCNNQCPLLDSQKSCQIFWVGLSAKKIKTIDEIPLSPCTNSGKIIQMVEQSLKGIDTYKTNLVKCVPLNEEQKLRYPNNKEINVCFDNLWYEIKILKPQIVFLLGSKVYKAVGKRLDIDFDQWNDFEYCYTEKDGVYYVPIQHPSYIYVYKKKNIMDYIDGIDRITNKIFNMKEFVEI